MIHPNQIFNEVMAHILNKAAYFRVFVKRRMSCEKWLQAEILHKLDELEIGGWPLEFEAEKSYPSGERCDVYFECGDFYHWIELQSVVTNYCGGQGKPITNQIDHVQNDIQRLVRVKNHHSKAHILFAAYPFSADGSDDDNWRKIHLERILPSLEPPRIWEFNVEGGMVGRFYLFQL